MTEISPKMAPSPRLRTVYKSRLLCTMNEFGGPSRPASALVP